jgi:hypothetical protein
VHRPCGLAITRAETAIFRKVDTDFEEPSDKEESSIPSASSSLEESSDLDESCASEADDGSGDSNDEDLEDESFSISRNAGRGSDAPARAGEAVAPPRQRLEPVQRFSARTKQKAWQEQEAGESCGG